MVSYIRWMKNGFSLVELSIVLVIVGLLVGGVLAGKSLIRAAELRSVSTDYERYRTATSAFRDKYFGLPGDITNASSFWGAAVSCPGDFTTPSTNAQTCNGDGDATIEYFGVTTSHEHMRAWQHLANAGLIQGLYTGQPASAELRHCVAGSNCPAGNIQQLAYMLATYTDVTATNAATFFIGNYSR